MESDQPQPQLQRQHMRLMAEYLACGCQVAYLAQGCIVLPCVRHEPKVLETVKNG